MKICVIVSLLGLFKTCVLETQDAQTQQNHGTRKLKKRQASDNVGAPLPYTSRDRPGTPSPLGHEDSSRDYQGPYPTFSRQAPPGQDDWADPDNPMVHNRPVSPEGRAQAGGAIGGANYSPSGGHPYYRYQPPVSAGRRAPGTLGLAGTQGAGYGSSGSPRAAQSRTYTYPFSAPPPRGHNLAGVNGDEEEDGRDDGDDQDDEGAEEGGGHGRQFGDSGQSVLGDVEPTVQAFPSEQPTVSTLNPDQLSRDEYLQLLRQRHQERQRILLQRQQQGYGQTAGQQTAGGQYSATGQQPQQPSSSSTSSTSSSSAGVQRQHRPSITMRAGGQQGVAQGFPTYYSTGVLRSSSPGGQASSGTGQSPFPSGGSNYASGGSNYASSGNGVYGGGQQVPSYNYGYGQGGSEESGYDSECPNTGIRIQINGIPCEQAIDHYGSYLCYRHEYTSRECCLRCRSLKTPARVGCEYGDHSGRCQQLQSYDCYDLRNRQSCCQTCERMQKQGARPGCEYGDMTPNCDRVRQSPGLCYIPENRYLCCETCSNLRVTEDPECPWGDQNPDLCQPFDRSGNIRINCYAPPIKRICCQSCKRLEEWIPFDQPGCEYGDKPVTFNTGSHRSLNCTTFMRYFGQEQCTHNQAVASNCCYTCHRYAQG